MLGEGDPGVAGGVTGGVTGAIGVAGELPVPSGAVGF